MNVRTVEKGPNAMDVALQRLRLMIVEGALLPGEQIRQQEMAESFGVSRVPLREALNVLADQGLLQHRPNAGYFVTKRTPDEIRQLRRMLEMLEDELVRHIRWPDSALLQQLTEMNAQMRAHARRYDWRQLVNCNRDFHFKIFGLSPDALILEEVRRLWVLAEPLIVTKLANPEASARTVVEHDDLLTALAAQDRDRFQQVLAIHRDSTNKLTSSVLFHKVDG